MPVTGDGLIIISRRLKAEAMCVKRLQRKTQIRLNPPYLIFSLSIAPNALTLVPFEPNIQPSSDCPKAKNDTVPYLARSDTI
jgi:hypothetical protein